MKQLFWLGLVTVLMGLGNARAQLAITETMSSASTNLGANVVTQGPDFWELSNFGTNTIDLTGYRFNDSDASLGGDADATTLLGVSIGPGESIILVQLVDPTPVSNRDDFITWWGASNLPATLQVLFYFGNGQSSTGDSIVLWDAAATLDSDYLDRADYGEAVRGHSFTYDTNNGAFGIISSNGFGSAFKAVTADDEGSPGTNTGPVALTITQHPTNLTVNAGISASFSAAATGLPHPRFQWRFGSNAIPGATHPTLVITNAQFTNAGIYSVIVSNGLETLNSSNATLTVDPALAPPSFTTTPKSAHAYVGQSFSLTAAATGNPVPTFQWQRHGTNLTGQTNSQLAFSNAQTNDSDTYTVLALNSQGTNPASAILLVTPKPKLVITEMQATEAAPTAGHADWFEVTSLDDYPMNLQGYRFDDLNPTLATATTFSNTIIIRPGESIIFVEDITPAAFRTWWGSNLPPGLQIFTVDGNGRGLGAAPATDAVNLYNAVATDNNDILTSMTYTGAPAGRSLAYDPENPPLGNVMSTVASNGVNGAWAATQSGDVGSPGYVVEPMTLHGSMTNGGFAVTWNTKSNRNYTLRYKDELAAGTWTTFTNVTATDTNTTVVDPGSSAARLYRVGVTLVVP